MAGLQGVLFTQAMQDSHLGLVADPGSQVLCGPHGVSVPWFLCQEK